MLTLVKDIFGIPKLLVFKVCCYIKSFRCHFVNLPFQ